MATRRFTQDEVKHVNMSIAALKKSNPLLHAYITMLTEGYTQWLTIRPSVLLFDKMRREGDDGNNTSTSISSK